MEIRILRLFETINNLSNNVMFVGDFNSKLEAFGCAKKHLWSNAQNYSKPSKGHVTIIFLPVIALSFLFFCPKLEQALHKQQEQHSWHVGDIFFKKGASKYLKMPFYVLES